MYIIVCIGVSTPHQQHYAPLSCQAVLKLANRPRPLFLGNCLALYWFFVNPPPAKCQIFQ